MKRKQLVTTGVCILMCSIVSTADALITGITATASNEYAPLVAQNTVNGSGMTGSIHDSVNTNMWLNYPTIAPVDSWIEFDFGQAQSVASIEVWNYNEANPSIGFLGTSRGIKKALIEQWDGSNWTTIIASQYLTIAPGMYLDMSDIGPWGTYWHVIDYDTPDVISLSNVTTSKIRFTVLETHGDTDYVGLSEVRFHEVPEPITVSLLGLGSLLTLRRRAQKSEY